MKRYIKSEIDLSIPVKLRLLVEVEVPSIDGTIDAITKSEVSLPSGSLPPADKNAIWNSQVLADYESFIETIEDLLTDYYEFTVYYKNSSKDHSYYFGLLAKDSSNTVILDFESSVRVSSHDPHRSQQSQYNKQQQKIALKQYVGDRKIKPLRSRILINDQEYSSYEEAYDEVVEILNMVALKMYRTQPSKLAELGLIE